MGRFALVRWIAPALLLFPAHGSAARAELPAAEASVLAKAQVDLPAALAQFVRGRVALMGPEQVAAQYMMPNGGPGAASVTIFIRPAGAPLHDELTATEQDIGLIFQGLTKVRDLAVPPNAPGSLGRLWSGQLHGNPILTGIMLSDRNGWRIKIRGTVSAEHGETGWAHIDGLIREFHSASASRRSEPITRQRFQPRSAAIDGVVLSPI
ncbi:MAG TPA: hypothetical protein VGW34_14070 [Allosphingosinicella sp.]|nr:hypothetical protein [Allosphingosinicella sp.]